MWASIRPRSFSRTSCSWTLAGARSSRAARWKVRRPWRPTSSLPPPWKSIVSASASSTRATACPTTGSSIPRHGPWRPTSFRRGGTSSRRRRRGAPAPAPDALLPRAPRGPAGPRALGAPARAAHGGGDGGRRGRAPRRVARAAKEALAPRTSRPSGSEDAQALALGSLRLSLVERHEREGPGVVPRGHEGGAGLGGVRRAQGMALHPALGLPAGQIDGGDLRPSFPGRQDLP